MRRRRAVMPLAAGLLVLFGYSGAAAQAAEGLRIEAVDARSFPTISVLVTPPPDLYGVVPTVVVIENGTPRPASVRLLAQEPLQVMLAVDTSGSMRGYPLTAAQQAARGFVTQLPPTTQVAVLGFSATPTLVSSFSEDRQAALDAIDRLVATGETALYDAVAAALEGFPERAGGRRFIVLLSDGGDTASATSRDAAIEMLAQSGVGFYAVELQTLESDPGALELLAGTTAGRVVAAEDPAALAAVYGLIATELVNQLVVTFDAIGGGPTSLAITATHGGVTASVTASLVLPGLGPTTTTSTTAPTVTTTRPAPTTTTTTRLAAPVSYAAPGPGALGGPWVLPAGVAAFGVAALVIFIMGLLPAGRARTGLAGVARKTRAASGGVLTLVADRARLAAESMISRGGRASALGRTLDSAGVRLTAGEFAVLTVCGCVAGMAVGTLLFRLPGALIFGVMGLAMPRLAIVHILQKRRAAFAEQLDGTLQLLAGSLRAGYGLMQSISTAAAETADPTAQEFGRIVVETRLGRDLVDSLDALAARMDSPDFRWVSQAIDIQRAVGGDLAQLFDTVSQTIRERNQIRRQIKALSAEGRISAYVLVSLPFILAVLISLVAPGFLTPLWETTPGKAAIGVGLALWVVGIAWIRRLVRLRF